jgi:hypothetical protein
MAYRKLVERLYREDANTVGKQNFISLYSGARKKALTRYNIESGSSATGLYPLNPQRVLSRTQKLLTKLRIPQPVETKVEPSVQSATLQIPMTSEAQVLLRSRIE